MKLLISAAAVLAFASPATAQDRGPGDVGSRVSTTQAMPEGQCTRGETVNGERCLCRRAQGESNSRLGNRVVCRTATGWREWDRAR